MLSRRMLSNAVLLTVAGALTACASMNEEECRTADWRRVGTQDGAQGYTDSRLAEHAEACAKIGIRPDANLWRMGWDQGVQTYCTPRVGWAEGMAGHTYQGVCRGRNEEAFLRPYRTASEIHRLQNQIDQNNNELRRLQSQLREADKDEARHRIRNRMRDLDSEQNLLRSNLNLIQLNAPRY